MKLILLSDTHFIRGEESLNKVNPQTNLESIITCINEKHADADLCLITGDLTDIGDRLAFQDLCRCLRKLKIPFRLLIGNHDNRNNFISVFPEQETDQNDFVQATITTSFGKIILLDTYHPGSLAGWYCKKRQLWLKGQLEFSDKHSILLFMHHPPSDIYLPNYSNLGKQEPLTFEHFLSPYQNRIRHIFFGHIHSIRSGLWLNIPFTSLPSTAFYRRDVPKEEQYCYAVATVDKNNLDIQLQTL